MPEGGHGWRHFVYCCRFWQILSNPYAVWAQSSTLSPGITMTHLKLPPKFLRQKKVHPIDIHTEKDLLAAHQENQISSPGNLFQEWLKVK